MADVPGLSFNGTSFTSMSSGGSGVMGKPVQVTLQTSATPTHLNEFAGLADAAQAVPGLVDVDVSYRPGKPEVLVSVDRRKAADLGINVATVGSTLRTLVEGSKVATFRGDGVEADIRVQLREEDRSRLDQILELQVPTQPRLRPLTPDRAPGGGQRPDGAQPA